jgi:hypothetical protein
MLGRHRESPPRSCHIIDQEPIISHRFVIGHHERPKFSAKPFIHSLDRSSSNVARQFAVVEEKIATRNISRNERISEVSLEVISLHSM